MTDDTRQIFDDLLIRWHHWSRGFRAIPDLTTTPMFRQARSGRQYDTQYELAERALDDDAMEAVDFHVNELCAAHRTAIQIDARNLATGRSVWRSARLPDDQEERAVLVGQARAELMARLLNAGIL